jgi:aspartate racemase
MKRIGIIGGLGPEGTIDYYKRIINMFNSQDSNLNYPEIIIYSVNISDFLQLMESKRYEQAVELMLEKLEALKRAGADFAAISANTPHLLFDRINDRSMIPLISIVEATCREALKTGSKRAGLLGTGFTMNSTFYADVFRKENIEIIIPEPDDRELVNYKLFSEIELGIFKEETRDMLIDIIAKMAQKQKIDSIILGCTEFPLILPDSAYAGIPVLNTTAIHVREIVDYCLNK